MTLSITYQELQQLIANLLHKNVELQSISNRAVKLTIRTSISKMVPIIVDSSAELTLSIYSNDLYIDYKALTIENMKIERFSRLIGAVTPNVVNIILNYLFSKYPQYNGIVKKVPDADRLRIHLAAIPQLQNVLQYVEVQTIVPQEDGLQIITKIRH